MLAVKTQYNEAAHDADQTESRSFWQRNVRLFVRTRSSTPASDLLSPKRGDVLVADETGWATADVCARFIAATKGKQAAAKQRLLTTLAYRASHRIDGLLKEPQPHFHTVKRYFPHGIVCMSRAGAPVLLMKVGEMKRAYHSMKDDGVTPDIAVRHMVFVFEYMWACIDTSPLPRGKAINIFDLSGMGMSDIAGEAMQFAMRCADVSSAHYPERLHKAFVINVPRWFSMLWNMVSPLLDPVTAARTVVLWKKEEIQQQLLEEIDAAELPVEYGGTSMRALYDAPWERKLFDYVATLDGQNVVAAAH